MIRKLKRAYWSLCSTGRVPAERPEWATELVAVAGKGIFWCDSPPPLEGDDYRLDHVTSVREVWGHWRGESCVISVRDLTAPVGCVRCTGTVPVCGPRALQCDNCGWTYSYLGAELVLRDAPAQLAKTSSTENSQSEAERPGFTPIVTVDNEALLTALLAAELENTEPFAGAAQTSLTSTDFLIEAAEIQEARGLHYDTPGGERSAARAAAAFNAITGKDLTPAEVYLLQQILKDVRQWSRNQYHHDSALDSVSYAALKAEALAQERTP